MNLREVTYSQNARNAKRRKDNSSSYRGVSFLRGKWQAYIGSGPGRYLGVFDTPEEAARAYDRAAYERDPESARLNFPDEWHTERG